MYRMPGKIQITNPRNYFLKERLVRILRKVKEK